MSPFCSRRSRLTRRRQALVLALLAAMSVSACGGADEAGAPDGNFVLYYDNDAPYFNGIVLIGEFDGDMEAIERLPEGASVTIERAE